MVKHRHEVFREELRKSIGKNLYEDARLMSGAAIARNVDAEVVNKCLLSVYGDMRRQTRRMIERSGDYDEMEKARASKGDYKLDAREFGLEQNVAEIYFNFYGHGYNGSPVIDRPHAPWICPGCGLKVGMSMKLFKPECPICHHITPLGELQRDGVLHH